MLVVVIDTEAEFDWIGDGFAPRQRRDFGKSLGAGAADFREIQRPADIRGRLSGQHDTRKDMKSFAISMIRGLRNRAPSQPWDTPPFVEAITDRNSYPGNLPEVEREKLVRLTAAIARNIGVQPRIYKAGRYGLGSATPGILAELGYEIDVERSARHQFASAARPGFLQMPGPPILVRHQPRACWRFRRRFDTPVRSPVSRVARALTTHPVSGALHVPGILSRLGLLERIVLTPEGVTFEEQRPLTRAMLRRGYRVFSLTYHSPSLAPGNTPYVRDSVELRSFLRCIDRYLEFFTGEVGGSRQRPLK